MHERFSDRARHAMALANSEAGQLRHDYLAPAHIMLGLINEGHCVATEALKVLDVDLEEVRKQVAAQLPPGEGHASVGRRAQTEATREVVHMAVDEARRLGHRYIGTEHLILALVAHGDSVPSKVLKEQGLNAHVLREKVLDMLRSGVDGSHDLAHSRHGEFEWMHQQEMAKAFSSPQFWHTLILAVDSANRLGSGAIESQHLLLALLRDEKSLAARLLGEKGITADWIRDRVAEQVPA